MAERPTIWALVPVKDLRDAKQRLADVLDRAERRELFRFMLEDVLSVLAECRSIAGVVLVTRDSQALALAARYGARAIEEARNQGHTAASSLGARVLAREGVPGIVQLPADIPLLSVGDVDALIAAHGPAPAVTIAPSRDERGSNAVVCSPPDVLPFRFGEDSFYPHLESARSLGIDPAVVERPGLTLDVDTPDDLLAFLAAPSRTRAYDYLVRSGIADRITAMVDDQSMPP